MAGAIPTAFPRMLSLAVSAIKIAPPALAHTPQGALNLAAELVSSFVPGA